jgi:DNA modification methylase
MKEIQYLKIKDLKAHPKNPRKITEDAMTKLRASIVEDREYFEARPCLISDRTGEMIIIAGNMRMKAAKAEGWKEVPCIIMSGLTEKDENRLLLKDNGSFGDWNYDLLAGFQDEFNFENLGIDVTIKAALPKDIDDIPEPPAIPTTQFGDIWLIDGKHRVMCGNSTDPEMIKQLMDGRKANICLTDPPYNVDYSGRGKETNVKIENDNMSPEAFRTLLLNAFKRMEESLKDDGTLYCCYASRTHREFEDSLNESGFEVKNQIIWVKLVASMGWGDYRWKHEPILYCHKKDKPSKFYGDRAEYTTWEEEKTDKELLDMFKKIIQKQEDGGSTVWRFGRDSNYLHPTQKPVALFVKAIYNSTRKGDLILDLFGGGGTTLIAAELTSRIAYICDLEPKWIDVTIERYKSQHPNAVITLIKE